MLVAAAKGKYGAAEQAISVKEALMVQGTLPRVLSVDEKVALPVSVFVSDPSIKKLKVSVEELSGLKLIGKKDTILNLNQMGEYDTDFLLKAGAQTGIAKLRIKADAGKHHSVQEIELDIRQANTPIHQTTFKMLKPGEKWEHQVQGLGMKGSNLASLEISPLPASNLGSRMEELNDYPHRTAEQCVSSAFPLLYLSKLCALSQEEMLANNQKVKTAIERLSRYQTADYGFCYWPDGRYADEELSQYATHFLLEAEKAGYAVPGSMKKNALSYLGKKARAYREEDRWNGNYNQAYRLYLLALANQADVASMNRLRKNEKLSNQSRFILASAYLLTGMKDAGASLIDLRDLRIDTPEDLYEGNTLRDRSMLLQNLLLMKQTENAYDLALEIARDLSSDQWFSNQSLAYALVAMAEFAAQTGAGARIDYSLSIGQEKAEKFSSNLLSSYPLSFDQKGQASFVLENQGQGSLFVVVSNEGVPSGIDRKTTSKGLAMEVAYQSLDGQSLDLSRIEQGEDFRLMVKVSNKTAKACNKLVLTQLIPAGWEIVREEQGERNYDYQDIRDDRVYTYFNLKANESRTFILKLNASYCGEFVLSPISCESLYERNQYYVRQGGTQVKVVK